MIKTSTKYDKLLAVITKEIKTKHKPGDKIAPEMKLAKKYGVNRTTVNKVIISLVNSGLLERSQGVGTFVKEAEKVVTLGVIVKSMSDFDLRHINGEININLLNGILDCSYQEKVKTEIIPFFPGSLSYYHSVDGFIILTGDKELLDDVTETGMPYIFCCNSSNLPEDVPNAVLNDVAQNIYTCIDFLAKKGRKRIAYLGRITHEQRLDAYLSALKDNKLEFNERLIVERKTGSIEDGYSGAAELLSRNEAFDALFCSTDLRACGALQLFQEKGMKVPEDVFLMGYDNILMSQETKPALTTFEPSRRERGKQALNELLKMITHKRYKPGTKTLPGKIIERETT